MHENGKPQVSRVLDIEEVCKIVGLSRATLRQLEEAGYFPKSSDGFFRWSADELATWIIALADAGFTRRPRLWFAKALEDRKPNS